MKHRVIWLEKAVKRLAMCYRMADLTGDKDRVMRASHTASQLLMADPIECSESREGEVRIVHESPLTLYFYMLDVGKGPTVYIQQVHYCPPLKRS